MRRDMKAGDHVIWLRSPGRSLLTGWRLQQVPGVIVGIGRRCIRIRVQLARQEKLVNVDPENVICVEDAGDPIPAEVRKAAWRRPA